MAEQQGYSKILVVGAGAVGSYLGGHLALAGHHVTLLGRDPLVQAIEHSGLTIRLASGAEYHTENLQAVSSMDAAFDTGQYDWLMFTMRAYDTVPAIFDLQRKLHHSLPIVSFQNGIGNEESLKSAFGHDLVVAATLTSPISMPAPAHVVEEKSRGIAIAEDGPAAGKVIHAFRQTRLPLSVVPRSDALKWSKLLLNMVGNATAAILDMLPCKVFKDPALFGIEYAALREALWIMEMNKIPVLDLPGAPVRTLAQALHSFPRFILRLLMLRQVCRGRGGKLPSLLLSLRSNLRETEVAWLNGAVAQAAANRERSAPINHALALLVTDIASGRVPWELYRGRPNELLAAIRVAQPMPRGRYGE
jgi:2-dehydropantoate 2-reductase